MLYLKNPKIHHHQDKERKSYSPPMTELKIVKNKIQNNNKYFHTCAKRKISLNHRDDQIHNLAHSLMGRPGSCQWAWPLGCSLEEGLYIHS